MRANLNITTTMSKPATYVNRKTGERFKAIETTKHLKYPFPRDLSEKAIDDLYMQLAKEMGYIEGNYGHRVSAYVRARKKTDETYYLFVNVKILKRVED